MATSTPQIDKATIETDAANYVLTAKNQFKDQRGRAGYEILWQLIEDSYNSKTIDYYSGVAAVKDPINFKIVERIVPKLKKILFPPDDDWFTVVAIDEKNSVQVQQAVETKSLLDEQYLAMNIKTKYGRSFRDFTMYGTVWSKLLWEHRVRDTFKRDKNNKRVKVFEVEYDNPHCYSPSIWDIYADIKDENLEGIVIEEIIKDFQDLWDNRVHTNEDGEDVGIYENVEGLNEVKNPRTQDTEKSTSEDLKGLADHTYGDHDHKIRIYECWGPIPKWYLTRSEEDKKLRLTVQGLIVVAVKGDDTQEGAGTVLRISDNPFDHQKLPYDRARYIAINGRLYGIGAIGPNLTIEMGANTVINQQLDMQTFNLRPKWLLDEGAEIDTASLKDLNEQIIETQDVKGLVALRPNDFTASALATISFFKNASEENSGATANLSGEALGASIERTTAGVAATQGNVLDRFEFAAENFVDELARPQFRKMWALNQQFLPKGRGIEIIGSGFTRVKPRKIAQPNIRFISISNQIQKELRINQLNILIQNAPAYQPLGLDGVPLLLEQIKLMGFKHLIPAIDKRPDSDERLEQTPDGEIILLRLGKKVRIDFDDEHDDFLTAYRSLLEESDLPTNVRVNTEKAVAERIVAKAMKNNPQAFANVIRSRKDVERSS